MSRRATHRGLYASELASRGHRYVDACTAPDDVVYYALHAWQSFNLEATRHELFITGEKALRDAVIPTLRKYVSYVMPSIFPAAALKIGQDAVKAPFELILLALCE